MTGIDPSVYSPLVDENCVVLSVAALPTGPVRFGTAFQYPDGSLVDLFLDCDPGGLFPLNRLTDFGRTLQWLDCLNFKIHSNEKRSKEFDGILKVLDVNHEGGEIHVALESQNDPVEVKRSIIRLGQACSRVADLSFMRRSPSRASVFRQEVEQILQDGAIEYKSNVILTGQFENSVPVDFLTQSQTAILTLSSANHDYAHKSANEVFRRFFDLPTWPSPKLTVYDDRLESYREEDLSRLRQVGLVVPFGRPDEVLAHC